MMTAIKKQIDYWIDTKTGDIKNDFDGLYTDHEDPWGCSKSHSSLNNKILLTCIADTEASSVLDIGCGTGMLSNEISKLQQVLKLDAFDISETAIIKAKNKFKNVNFYCAKCPSEMKTGPYEAIVASEIVWYVANQIDTLLQSCWQLLTDDGLVIIKQYFPGKQMFFKEKIDGYKGFIEIVGRNNFIVEKNIAMGLEGKNMDSVHVFILSKIK
jgi:2-polyprenyl-3-methyl-5-hydroxy-6-metoxy-1,4-benzoquinol methylase